MKPILLLLDKIRPAFEPGGKLEKLYPLFEATDTFLYTTDEVTTVGPHVRDSMDLKRIMTIVVYALTPCVFDQVESHRHVRVEEPPRVGLVGADPADLSRKMQHHVRLRCSIDATHGGLVSQIESTLDTARTPRRCSSRVLGIARLRVLPPVAPVRCLRRRR